MKFTIFPFLILAIICGCAEVPPPKPNVVGSPADYGAFPSNYTNLVNLWLSVNTKDPDSVKALTILPPHQFFTAVPSINASGYLISHSLPLDTVFYGYRIDLFCNSKNSFGAYGGVKDYSFLVRNGEIIETIR